MSIRIAIATPTPLHRCETFIANHIERLDHVELLVTDGMLPAFDRDGVSLLGATKWARAVDKIAGALRGEDWRSRVRKRIAQLLIKERVQVVLAEYGNTASEVLPSCQAAGVPLVAYFLGYDAYRGDQLHMHGNYEKLFAGATTIVAVSRAIREQLIALGAPPEKVIYNSCGADLRTFTACEPGIAPPHFLAVGRFVEKKAPHLTVKAFARIAKDRPEARLTMVGDGDLLEQCQQLVHDHGLEGQVDLCGKRTPAEIAQLLQRSRAFVQHSIITASNDREGTPVAILEAMGAGVPVISTRHGDIVELVKHGDRGLLCDEGDVDGMAANMLHLIDRPDLVAQMGAAARSYVFAEHRVEDRIASLQDILEHAAGKAKNA